MAVVRTANKAVLGRLVRGEAVSLSPPGGLVLVAERVV